MNYKLKIKITYSFKYYIIISEYNSALSKRFIPAYVDIPIYLKPQGFVLSFNIIQKIFHN